MCGCASGNKMKYGSKTKENNMQCRREDQYLFYHRIVVRMPMLLMKRLLTVCAIPVSNRDGFHSVIPKLALLPPISLFGSELGGFKGRGRAFRRPSTF